MKVGDLVDDLRCKGTHHGKAGLVLYVDHFDETARVRWRSSPEMPLWAPMRHLRLVGSNACNTALAYSADPMSVNVVACRKNDRPNYGVIVSIVIAVAFLAWCLRPVEFR